MKRISTDRRSRTAVGFLIVLAIVASCSVVSDVAAQDSVAPDDSIYRVELHAEFGPMASAFVRGRELPSHANEVALGYNGAVRIMWHPDHLLAVGLLCGYEQFISEQYTVTDAQSIRSVHGRLNAVPFMFDVSLEDAHFELGVGLGACIISTVLVEGTTARSSRIEVASNLHATYFSSIATGLYLGAELRATYLAYRGIFALAPQIDLRYDILRY